MHSDEDNCFTKKKNAEGLTGNINVSSCLPIALEDIKRVSQAKNATINDVVLCALTTSLNVLFKEKQDHTKRIYVVMPGNIRFGFYKKREEVKCENKFTAMPL